MSIPKTKTIYNKIIYKIKLLNTKKTLALQGSILIISLS